VGEEGWLLFLFFPLSFLLPLFLCLGSCHAVFVVMLEYDFPEEEVHGGGGGGSRMRRPEFITSYLL